MMQTFKVWYESQSGYDICNNLEYGNWLHKQNFSFIGMLTRKNVDALKFLFGRQFAVYNGEFKYYVWKYKYNDLLFLIFSSR